jgi:hypothetical protein
LEPGSPALLSAALIAAALSACASVAPNPVDVTPVARLVAPQPGQLVHRFPDFQAVVAYRAKTKPNAKPVKGPVEWVSGSLAYTPSWSVEVDVLTFQSGAEAEDYRNDRCWMMSQDLGHGAKAAQLEESGGGAFQSCKTPIVELRKEAWNLPFDVPSDDYMSGAVVRNDRLVIRLVERRTGRADGAPTALDWALAKIAARLNP